MYVPLKHFASFDSIVKLTNSCPVGAEGVRRAQQRVRGAPERRAARCLHPGEGGEAGPVERLPFRGLPRLAEAYPAYNFKFDTKVLGQKAGRLEAIKETSLQVTLTTDGTWIE